MSDCWVCDQKAAWLQDKKNAALALATKEAKDNEKTMAVWKEGCNWKHGEPGAIPPGATSIEYISKHQ